MTKKNGLTTLISVFLLALFILSSLMGSGARFVRAATSSIVAAYEQSNVWDDLNSATIGGESIDLNLYNFDESKNVQIVSFVEFCYSYKKDKQDDFGLYVYVYNPRGYDWTQKPELNKISLRYGGNSNASFNKYYLQYLNRSEAAGYEGLFYKFKIAFSSWQREAVLENLNSTARIYEVSKIELYHSGSNATAYDVTNKHTYTGYAKGYGSDNATDDTLTCKSDGLDLSLSLNVVPFQYRPSGNNGSEYTKDILYSVYFSIPNKILKEYGDLAAVHATWLNAKTAPIWVTGNQDIYNSLNDWLLEYEGIADSEEFPEFTLLANAKEVVETISIMGGDYVGNYATYKWDNAFNITGILDMMRNSIWKDNSDDYVWGVQQKYTTVYDRDGQLKTNLALLNPSRMSYLFYAKGGAENYIVPNTEILEWLKEYTKIFGLGDNSVLGKYSPYLFSSVDEEFTDMTIHSTDIMKPLTSEVWGQNLWDVMFGGQNKHHVVSSETYKNIKALMPIKKTDFKSSVSETCKHLYMEERDYSDFKNYYDKATGKDETVYILRYYQDTYSSKPVTECRRIIRNEYNRYPDKNGSWDDWTCYDYLDKIDTNAYCARMTLTLDFDIIDVTCRKGEVSTVIPCVMSPKDIAPDVTPPPVEEVPDDTAIKKMPWWGWVIIGVVGVIVLLTVLSIVFPQFGVLMRTLINRGFSRVTGLINRSSERRQRKQRVREEKLLRKERMQILHYQNKLDREELNYRNKLDAKEKRKAAKKAQKQKAKSKNKKRGAKKK